MKKYPLLFICFAFMNCTSAQKINILKPETNSWTAYQCEPEFNDGMIHLKSTGGTAVLWLDGSNFKNGIIELDIKGKDVDGKSFVGLAFHGLDNKHYEAVYFRPFNFKSTTKKGNAIQYISMPDNDWFVLRKKFPAKYENAVESVPDPNDWFHVRVVIDFPVVKVYVNHVTDPTLVVKQISQREQGKIGLWIDSEEGWFKNLSLQEAK